MPPPTSTPTILIADDEAAIVYIVENKLAKAGYRVVVARNGLDALRLAVKHRPALAITDLNMPIMNGMAFSVALRENPDTADIPIVMLTGRGHTVPEQDLARTNIRHLESKPFSAKHLVTLIDKMLGKAKAA